MIEHLYLEEGRIDDEAFPYLNHAIVLLLPKLTNAVTWQRMGQKLKTDGKRQTIRCPRRFRMKIMLSSCSNEGRSRLSPIPVLAFKDANT